MHTLHYLCNDGVFSYSICLVDTRSRKYYEIDEKWVKAGLEMPLRREERSEGERKRLTQGSTLSHRVEQEVLDGNALPSCQHADHQHWHHSASRHRAHVTNITSLCVCIYIHMYCVRIEEGCHLFNHYLRKGRSYAGAYPYCPLGERRG